MSGILTHRGSRGGVRSSIGGSSLSSIVQSGDFHPQILQRLTAAVGLITLYFTTRLFHSGALSRWVRHASRLCAGQQSKATLRPLPLRHTECDFGLRCVKTGCIASNDASADTMRKSCLHVFQFGKTHYTHQLTYQLDMTHHKIDAAHSVCFWGFTSAALHRVPHALRPCAGQRAIRRKRRRSAQCTSGTNPAQTNLFLPRPPPKTNCVESKGVCSCTQFLCSSPYSPDPISIHLNPGQPVQVVPVQTRRNIASLFFPHGRNVYLNAPLSRFIRISCYKGTCDSHPNQTRLKGIRSQVPTCIIHGTLGFQCEDRIRDGARCVNPSSN